MSLPDVSVIVTCYDYGRYLERCLRSLFNQEHSCRFSYEVIMVDDASTDESDKVCAKFSNRFDNFKTVRNIRNRGLAASCNIGIDNADGRYIVRVDADDYVNRHFLWLLKIALDKNRKYQAFCCDYAECNEFEQVIAEVSAEEHQIACGTMYRREFLFDVGLYDEEYEYREGHELRVRFEQKYKVGHLPIPLYYVRKHGSNRSDNKKYIAYYDSKIEQEYGDNK